MGCDGWAWTGIEVPFCVPSDCLCINVVPGTWFVRTWHIPVTAHRSAWSSCAGDWRGQTMRTPAARVRHRGRRFRAQVGHERESPPAAAPLGMVEQLDRLG